jgi:SAM-dependent methyltransferase
VEYVRRNIKRLMTIIAHPRLGHTKSSLCEILKRRAEIDECTRILHRHGFVSHGLTCKDWDLAHILPEVGDGNFLDMGSSDSYILRNLSIKKICGELHGIDLREPDAPVKGVKYTVGDLMDTKFPNNHFKNITCLSVIEHEVDFNKFARETSRLLQDKGKLFVTFDYWEPKIIPPIKMYDLKWQPLDMHAVKELIAKCENHNLYPIQDMDWTIGDAVITYDYYSPHPAVDYTFGLVTFGKHIS